jgi:serine/threonine protein kinase
MMQDDPLVGKHLHEYRVDRLIGRGNMASVYLATDFRLQRKAAIKVNRQDYQNDANYVMRVLREGQVMAQLSHPHIVQAYRLGEVDQTLYLAMQYIEGADLSIVLKSYKEDREYIETPEAARIIREIASALDYAHREGVIHRDVKPSNIMLDNRGWSYLTDFGLVLVTVDGTIGDVLGTPYYIAPEQAISSADAIPQSDLYSLGIVMYEMFTNVRPFEANRPLAIAMMHVSSPPRPPRELRPEISPEVEAVILKSIAKKPEARYQSGAEMSAALDEAIRVGGIGERTGEVPAVPIRAGTILSRTPNFPLSDEEQDLLREALVRQMGDLE